MSARLLSKPLIGGPFGAGRYAIASVPVVLSGLHGARFMVVDQAGAVLSVADTRVDAIAGARRVLQAAADLARAANDDLALRQAELFPRDERQEGQPLQRAVTRRRREVFNRGTGQCFYCHIALELAGDWHVEHVMPRTLGGTDDPLNLVPACARCNLSKGSRTGLEFMATGGAGNA